MSTALWLVLILFGAGCIVWGAEEFASILPPPEGTLMRSLARQRPCATPETCIATSYIVLPKVDGTDLLQCLPIRLPDGSTSTL